MCVRAVFPSNPHDILLKGGRDELRQSRRGSSEPTESWVRYISGIGVLVQKK